MNNFWPIVNLVLKAVGLAMAVACLVLGVLGTTTVETLVTLLSIGLFALSLAVLQTGSEPE